MAKKIVLATRNPDKVSEITAILARLHIEITDLTAFPDCTEVEEDGDTLEANALKKARTVAKHTGLPAVADDTGLEVYYLINAPGVYSARYAGEDATYADNVRKLLHELNQAPPRRRGARFRTVVAYVDGKTEETYEGIVEGAITFSPQGEGGFGYDPVFKPAGYDQTFAEMPIEEKNRISHRAKAFDAFAEAFALTFGLT